MKTVEFVEEDVMGRPRNDEMRREVYGAAFRLLAEKGYEKMSYSDIAAATGLDRSHIQYYIPKKEHLVRVLQKATFESIKKWILTYKLDDCSMVQRFALGVEMIYALSLFDNSTRRVTKDIIRDHSFGDELALFSSNAVARHLKLAPEDETAFIKALEFSNLGAQGMVYHGLRSRSPIDIKTVVSKTISEPLRIACGYSPAEVDDLVHSYEVSMQDQTIVFHYLKELIP